MAEGKGRPTVGWTEESINEYTTKVPDGVEVTVGAGRPAAGISKSKCTDNKWAYCDQCVFEMFLC